MKAKNYILSLAAFAALLMVSACRDKHAPAATYVVEGHAPHLADGSRLLLVDGDGMTIDTLTVADGRFSYTGAADSVVFCTLVVEGSNMNSVGFFTEAGTISVTVENDPSDATVGGTEANDALQELLKTTDPYFKKISEMEQLVYSDTTRTYDQWAMMERYNQLLSEVYKQFNISAEQNIGNELGFKLIVEYIDPVENADLLRRLIGQLPERFRRRQQIVLLEQRLQARDATAVGQTLPQLALPTPADSVLDIGDEVRRHRLTILDFWASWCGPCRQEMPSLKKLYADYQARGLAIVGISLDESAVEWNRAIGDLKLPWTQVSDLLGWNSKAAQLFQVDAIPFTVVADAEGTILAKGLRGDELRRFVEAKLQ